MIPQKFRCFQKVSIFRKPAIFNMLMFISSVRGQSTPSKDLRLLAICSSVYWFSRFML